MWRDGRSRGDRLENSDATRISLTDPALQWGFYDLSHSCGSKVIKDLHRYRDLFAEILAADAEQYGNRIDGFRADPAGTLRQTLEQIPRHGDFREHYERFVAELVYGERRPTFDEAFTTFRSAADSLLSSRTDNREH